MPKDQNIVERVRSVFFMLDEELKNDCRTPVIKFFRRHHIASEYFKISKDVGLLVRDEKVKSGYRINPNIIMDDELISSLIVRYNTIRRVYAEQHYKGRGKPIKTHLIEIQQMLSTIILDINIIKNEIKKIRG